MALLYIFVLKLLEVCPQERLSVKLLSNTKTILNDT